MVANKIDSDKEISILRVYMEEKPSVYRDIAIRSSASLYQLADTVVIDAFDWNFDHAFGFYSNLTDCFDSTEMYELFVDMGQAEKRRNDVMPLSVRKNTVGKVFDICGKKMLFLFDYGDAHTFIVELIDWRIKEKGFAYPLVLKSEGEFKKEYIEE